MITRRQVVAAAAAAPLVGAVPAAAQQRAGDAAILFRIAEIEQALRTAYRTVAQGGGEHAPLGRQFLAQEREHLAALATSLEALGSERPERIETDRELTAAAAAVGVRFEGDPIAFLLALERESARRLEQAAARMGDLNLMQTCLTILGCQAQHIAVLTPLAR